MDYTQLIERLDKSFEAETLCADAAEAIEALQKQVFGLNSEVENKADYAARMYRMHEESNAEVEALQARVTTLQYEVDAIVAIKAERDAALAKLKELEAQARNRVPEAWTNLLAYVLQGDMQNRLTPRVIDIAYSAFALAKQPNTENGEASDWFNDTKPSVENLIAKLRKDLVEELEAQPSPTALELMTEYSNGKQWAQEHLLSEAAINAAAAVLADGYWQHATPQSKLVYASHAREMIVAALKEGL